jgi:hypothetical protein
MQIYNNSGFSSAECIHWFCLIIKINNNYLTKQHELIDLCNREVVCFFWERDWIFKYCLVELRVFEVLIHTENFWSLNLVNITVMTKISHVKQQQEPNISSIAQWAELNTTCFFWDSRNSRSVEVDISTWNTVLVQQGLCFILQERTPAEQSDTPPTTQARNA